MHGDREQYSTLYPRCIYAVKEISASGGSLAAEKRIRSEFYDIRAVCPMQRPRQLTPTPGENFPPSAPARKPRIVPTPDIVCQITSRIKFRLTTPVTESRKAISIVVNIPVVGAQLSEGFKTVERTPRPERRNAFAGSSRSLKSGC